MQYIDTMPRFYEAFADEATTEPANIGDILTTPFQDWQDLAVPIGRKLVGSSTLLLDVSGAAMPVTVDKTVIALDEQHTRDADTPIAGSVLPREPVTPWTVTSYVDADKRQLNEAALFFMKTVFRWSDEATEHRLVVATAVSDAIVDFHRQALLERHPGWAMASRLSRSTKSSDGYSDRFTEAFESIGTHTPGLTTFKFRSLPGKQPYPPAYQLHTPENFDRYVATTLDIT